MAVDIPIFPLFDWNLHKSVRSGDTVPAVFDAPERIWTASGEAAIFFALKNAGLNRGDAILVPTYHCPTMIRPASYLGLETRFYPLAERGQADLDFIETRFRTSRVQAVLLAHYFGFPQPIRRLRELCDRYGVILVEDCAHALFGVADGAPPGSWGDYAIASLPKFLPLAWGGCLVSWRKKLTARPEVHSSLLQTARKWLDVFEIAAHHGRPVGMASLLRGVFGVKKIVRQGLRGRHGHLPDPPPNGAEETVPTQFDVALAMTLPPRYIARAALGADRSHARDRRQQIFHRLTDSLSGIPGIKVLHPELDENVVPYVFPVLSDAPDALFQRARQQGVTVFRWDRRWPGTPSGPGDTGAVWSDRLLQFPCQQSMSDDDVDRVIAILSR